MNRKKSFLSLLLAAFLFISFIQVFIVDAKVLTFATTNALMPYTYVDSLKDGMVFDNKDIVLEGWSLNSSGVKEIKVYLDNKYLGSAALGISREDVAKAFPGYVNGANSGFKYTINKSLVSIGTHKVKLIAVGNDSSQYTVIANVSTRKLEPYTFIDTVKDGMVIDNKDINLEGWSLNFSGIKEIKVHLDNKYLGSATIGISREDVDMAFPGYINGANSGFKYTINKSLVSAGTHQVKLISIGNDGSQYTSITSFSSKKLEPYTFIDTPKNGVVIDNKDINLEGWSLNSSGVKEIKVHLDDKYLGSAVIGISREDVGKAFPGYTNGSNSGFKYTINKSLVSSGNHKVKLISVGNDGSQYITTMTFTLTLRNLEPYTYIDTLKDGQTIAREIENFNISGWSLNSSGVKEIRVLVDSNYVGNATIGLSRPDVNAAFPGYTNGDKSGFSIIVNTSSLSSGNHELAIEAHGYDGSINRTMNRFSITSEGEISLNYKASIANMGWSDYVNSDVEIGVTNNSRHYIDAMALKLNNATKDMKIKYEASINNIGWQNNWSENGQVIGTPGSVNAIEAIKIKLEGVSSDYHVVYRTYIRGQGWQGWVADGTISGVIGKGDVIEALDVKLVETTNISQYIKPKIAIDLGHNVNGDVGAVGIRIEAEVVRDVGARVISKLKAQGYTIIETLPKTAASTVDSLDKRSYIANINEADFFASIHFNAAGGVASGTEVFYYKNTTIDKLYATNIVNNISLLGFKNRGIKFGDFSVIRKTLMPSVLIECCFVDSRTDMEIYDPERMANAIVAGIVATK